MADKGTFEIIITDLARILKPLADAAETGADGVRELADEAGLDLNRILSQTGFQDLLNAANSFKNLYGTLRPIADTSQVDTTQLPSLIAEIRSLIDSVKNLDNLQVKSGVPAEFAAIGKRLLDHLIFTYLFDYHPAANFLLLLFGIIDTKGQQQKVFPQMNYARLPKVFTDIGGLAGDVYDWGTNDFDSDLLLVRLQPLLRYGGITAQLVPIEAATSPAGIDTERPLADQQLRIPLFEVKRSGDDSEVGLSLIPLAPSGNKSRGIALVPFGIATVEEKIRLQDNWQLKIQASADSLIPWGIAVRPEGVELTGLAGSIPPPRANLAITVEREIPSDMRTLLLGSVDGPRVELGTIGLKIGLEFERDWNFFIELPVRDLRTVISVAEGDGFLQKILPENGVEANFDLALGISPAHGVYFRGSTGLEILLPTHISLGPLEFQSLTICLKISNGAIPITAGATIKAHLGPLKASVEDLGIQATFSFSDNNSGNLGPIDLSLGFKPPNGVGLAIDTGVVKGGGYLYFDFDKEEYAGALELVFSEFLTLKAIGLITTRMPDGSKGFSLLVIITAEFGSPIQLSFGFTLNCLGGLLALNRTMRLQPLVEGVRTGAVNSVMFPTNVVENAPRIISDLRTFFPPQLEIFLIGPMAKIGWGTPSLVTLSLGIIIEIPGNIAILGILKVALPDEDAALLVLQVNFMGAIEFDKKRAWIFAGLYESRVLFITIEGQMGVLVAWGDNANFVVSVGGFHPAFNPPPLPFPEPNRIAVSILNTSFAKIRAEGYFAVTSNTVQFGARAELFFGVSAFKIDGHIAFDALFQFSPFYFIISISSSLGVKVFGIGLFSVRMRGSLEGPTPWHVEGTGSISLLFFDIDVDFSHTWGEEAETTLPPIQVMPLLKAEYEKLENWRAEVPAANNILVSLRKIETTEDIVLHPVGTLKISQRLAPLDLTIDKLGAQKPSDANYFTLSVDTEGVNAEDIEEIAAAEEMFAMPQFKDMADSKKLSSPAFEKQKGGVEVSAKGEQLKTTSAVKRVVRYEQIIIDSNFKRFVKPFFKLIGVLFNLFLNGSAITKSTLSNKYKKQKMPFADKIAVMPNAYAVAFNTDNAPFNEEAKAFTSYAQAEEFMNQKVKGDPNLQDSLHVIPEVEMKRAA